MSKCPYHDPFAEKRKEGPVMQTEFDGDPVAMILGLKDVRGPLVTGRPSAPMPFRVPIPRRGFEKRPAFPIESDPPDHTDYRKIVNPLSALRTRIPSSIDRLDFRNDFGNDFLRIL